MLILYDAKLARQIFAFQVTCVLSKVEVIHICQNSNREQSRYRRSHQSVHHTYGLHSRLRHIYDLNHPASRKVSKNQKLFYHESICLVYVLNFYYNKTTYNTDKNFKVKAAQPSGIVSIRFSSQSACAERRITIKVVPYSVYLAQL